MSRTRTLLFEIGTEEIPAAYLETAIKQIIFWLKYALQIDGVSFGNCIKYYTPRRMTIVLENVSESSKEMVHVKKGPPAKIAKDADGNWTEPAKKFAKSQGASESDLFIEEDEKGSYVRVEVKEPSKETITLLPSSIYSTLYKILYQGSIFPRRMSWPQVRDSYFARPIRWLCCLYGNEIVRCSYQGLESSNISYGHRFAHPEEITINSPGEYVDKLRQASVIVDPNERREEIQAELEKAAQALGGELVADPDLLIEVTNLVECPNILTCNLGGFMDLPRQVLQTALAKHQRAFVVEKKGKLIPHFLVVTNSPKLKPDLARPWFERMAISRLEDADFFIKEDLDKGLKPLVQEETRVEWIKGIGTLADKTRFLTELGTFLGKDVNGFDKEIYTRSAKLAKADLLSNLVREKEFTSLEGIAGAIYAERLGESKEVCAAIGSQYSDSPTTLEGAILGVADRHLNICATFLVGKPPKGSRDPFALRRQATAVMKILTRLKIHTDIPAAVKKVLELFGKKEKEEGQILDFLKDREVLFFKDKGFTYDWVDAVAAVAADDPYDAFLRLKAFGELDKGDEFRLVAVGQKRVANITRSTQFSLPDTSLFDQAEEKKLWEETERIRPEVESAVGSRNYKKALDLLLSIRPAIDKFFDEVFVMVEDEEVKNNRLHLLNSVKQEFLKVADFSKIVVEGGEK